MMKKWSVMPALVLALLLLLSVSPAFAVLSADAGGAYLEVLKENGRNIRKEIWNMITRPIAFADLTGDGAEELVFVTHVSGDPNDSVLHTDVVLNVYTYRGTRTAGLLLSDCIGTNYLNGSGPYTVYRLPGRSSDLFAGFSFGEGGTSKTTLIQYSVSGSGAAKVRTLTRVESAIDDSVTYYIDGSKVSQQEYDTALEAMDGEKEVLISHNGPVSEPDPSALGMSYDDAVAYLNGIAGASGTGGVGVTVNGAPVRWTDAEPFIDGNNRTMVPLRAVAEALGLGVSWDGASREAIFTDGRKTLYFPIGSNAARTGDGGSVMMDTAAVIVNDRTYAPIRYLAEYFGFSVGWDAATKTVLIRGSITKDPDPPEAEKTEAELKALLPSDKKPVVSVYDDFDGDGRKEAFVFAIDRAKPWSTDGTAIDSVYFMSSRGERTMMTSIQTFCYESRTGYRFRCAGKVFVAADNGGYGSGFTTLLFGVKDGQPYELDLSRKIQGVYEQNGKLYTTANDFSKGYHTYPVYELLYDADAQQFYVGDRVAESLGDIS